MPAKLISAQPYFHIRKPLLGIGLSYDFKDEERTGPEINSRDVVHDFRERLDIATEGWVYNPALCEYKLQLIPEWSQRKEEHGTESGRKKVFLQGYFFNTTFLKFKPYTLNIFGQKEILPVRSAFASTTETERDILGASLSLKNRVLPTVFTYSQQVEDQKGFYSSHEETEKWRFNSSHSKGSSKTQLHATYEEKIHTTETVTSDINSLDSSIVNNYEIKGATPIRFNSLVLQRLTESSSLETSGIQVSENIDWEHRKNLRSNYRLFYNRNESGDFLNESKSVGAGLSHLLYENLTTNISGEAMWNDFTGGDETSYTGRLGFNYRRAIPWGLLGLNIGYDYRLRRRFFEENYIPVIDESHTLTGLEVTLLDNEHVDIDSIRVTDITGTTIYIKDIDYRIQEIGYSIRLSRTTFGSIGDGDTVLVSYRYLSRPSFDDSIFGQSYGINLDLLSGLQLSYQYRRSEQKFLDGIPPDTLEDDTIHTATLELTWRFTNTKIFYEDADRSTGNSIETWFVEEALTFRPAFGFFVQVSGRFGGREFKLLDDTEDFYGLGFKVDWIPLSWCKIGLRGSLDDVSGVSENTIDTELGAIFEMSFAIWNGSLSYSYLNEEDQIVDQTRRIHNIRFEIMKIKF